VIATEPPSGSGWITGQTRWVRIDGEPKWQDGITEVSVMKKNAGWFYLPRNLSFTLPTAFWIFPPTFWAFPSACSFESPVSLPAADFTLPLA
jgi:hypothetical protein